MATLTDKKCRECRIGNLEIVGTAGFDDMVEVHCTNPECDETYEVEPDGLGMCGDEMLVALMLDMEGEHFEDVQADIDAYLGKKRDVQ